MRINLHDRRYLTAAVLSLTVAGFAFNLGSKAYAQQIKKKEAQKKEETYTRPKPTRPIQPEVPSANRYRQDKIFLEYADSLFRVENRFDTVEKQIVKGNVKFRQAGMWMYCDSAYYYPTLNSMDAFGHVKMEQGDTLFVYADKLFYEGNERLAKLQNGPSRDKVKLINRDVTLTTDSLDYSLALELGWYSRWGTIDDKVNTLTSLYGEYSPGTKKADFYHDVVLVNNRDGYTMLTDTLYYNTDIHIARIESRTTIQGKNDTIITTRGLYDTQLGNAELMSRSMIVHKDSNNNVTTLEGDSIIYDKATRISRAYMFDDPAKHGMPMVLTDTAHKITLIGGYGVYNDSTREALATVYPLLMEYSQTDTLFLRSDTIRTYIITEMVEATRRWTKSGLPEKDGVPIIRADSGLLWIDPLVFSLSAPMESLPMSMLAQAAPKKEEQTVVEKNEPQISEMEDTLAVGSEEEEPEQPEQEEGLAEDEEKFPEDAGKIRNSTDSLQMTRDSIPLIPKEFHVALAYHRARFFKQDIQGVADSIVFVESDSMMYMFRKPIVWSGERQVTGNRIDVHFNDSTADWAELPESGMMSEYIDEDFYNQLTGKKLVAYFSGNGLKNLDVSGNVEAIFLPQESDSTYNRIVNAESSFLSIDLDGNQMERLKMWPEVTGTVTPLFLVKRSQMYLRNFHWWESLRPVREWYGDRVRWQDNLGEVPDELERYFLAPSDFGEPKTFSATRFVRPATSLTVTDETIALEEPAPKSLESELPDDATLKSVEE
ncbi:MAG: hypothetical protein K2J48_05250, partial [Muribaculaceae bacterium]|nr:hypothetical protein [Muribaculaceae bacterium]